MIHRQLHHSRPVPAWQLTNVGNLESTVQPAGGSTGQSIFSGQHSWSEPLTESSASLCFFQAVGWSEIPHQPQSLFMLPEGGIQRTWSISATLLSCLLLELKELSLSLRMECFTLPVSILSFTVLNVELLSAFLQNTLLFTQLPSKIKEAFISWKLLCDTAH